MRPSVCLAITLVIFDSLHKPFNFVSHVTKHIAKHTHILLYPVGTHTNAPFERVNESAHSRRSHVSSRGTTFYFLVGTRIQVSIMKFLRHIRALWYHMPSLLRGTHAGSVVSFSHLLVLRILKAPGQRGLDLVRFRVPTEAIRFLVPGTAPCTSYNAFGSRLSLFSTQRVEAQATIVWFSVIQMKTKSARSI